MGHTMSSVDDGKDDSRGEIQELGSSKLVVQHVEVKRVREIIKVPHIVIEERPTVKYTVQEAYTTQYKPVEEQTTRYNIKEETTIKYTPREEETVKYIPVEVKCEKPVVTDKLYERPVIQDKTYQLVSFTDLEAIKEAMEILPKLLEEIKELRKVKIVEEIIKVPKINYVPTDVYKITQSGELVKDGA